MVLLVPAIKFVAKLNIPSVLKKSQDIGKETINKYALLIEGQTKILIVANGQVDTGFMLNSVYTILAGGQSSYLQTWPSGTYNGKSRTKEAQRGLSGKAVAAVGVSASYALWQELRQSFLFAAAGSVQTLAAGSNIQFGITS